MNIHEAYNKGLTDAENVVIEKLQAYLDGSETSAFNNPELERIRQELIKFPAQNEPFLNNTPNELLFMDTITSLISDKRDGRVNYLRFDDRKNGIVEALSVVMDHLWANSYRQSSASKFIRNLLKEAKSKFKP